MSPRSPVLREKPCTCQHRHDTMELRFGRTYPRCPTFQRYRPYRPQRPTRVGHSRFIPWNTARGRASWELPLVPFELQAMIVQEVLLDTTASIRDLNPYLLVCKSWYVPIKIVIEERQYKIIRERLLRQNNSLGVLCTYYRFRRGWDKSIQKVIRDDTELRERLAYDAVRYDNIEAARILFGGCGIDAKEIFVRCVDVEEPLNTFNWTAMQTARDHGHATMIALLADEFGALDGKCKSYIMDLINVVVEQENIDAWITLSRHWYRAPS